VNKFVLVDTTYLLPIFGILLKLDGIERRGSVDVRIGE